jgi:hypothetical protein
VIRTPQRKFRVRCSLPRNIETRKTNLVELDLS